MSEKNHVPERSCVVCRAKKNKFDLFRLIKSNEEKYIFDSNYKAQSRGIYVCKSSTCLERLSKHKKFKVDTDNLLKMITLINKKKKNYLNILSPMKNSGKLIFGINLFFENIENIYYILIAEDIADKNREKILNKAKEYKIPFLFVGDKKSLGKIFDKEEVNVIGIKDKNMARGLIIKSTKEVLNENKSS
ncbi:MAG: DUF448 domain-containing protein [Fusobacterium sp.]|uniref:DUF448 domain-containing protein n=1 Tax=Fusobacterium sp. TaxID=68766 RepID=UPI0026DB79E0|nr:DUF448 domain-containing protein [Fusobacterium sp.]MDO4689730.1 DUF448 domain-containing protein [Fusobacterium sp.]